MAKKHWISVCEQEDKKTTPKEQIIWESSSSEDEGSIKRPVNNSYERNFHTWSQSQENTSHDANSNCSSPILNLSFCNLNSISPELTTRKIKIQNTIPSPAIEKYRFRKRRRVNRQIYEKERSPELFIPDPTQHIDSESPISDFCEPHIEPFESQFGSPVKQESNPFVPTLYYEPPKRKKSCKKGGLAHQLQHTLKFSRSRLKIWEYEKQTDIGESQEAVIQFQGKQCWTEYGVTLWECDFINKISSFSQAETSNKLIVNLGVTQILNIQFEENLCYELYPPYVLDTIEYRGQCLPYYYNVSRVIKRFK